MVDFLITGIFWVLALYGLIEIIKTISLAFTRVNFKKKGIYLIIAVKNQEEQIEGFLRSILFRIIYGKEDFIDDIYITDLNSTDRTKSIIEKLGKEYNQIKLYDWQMCRKKIEKKG